MFAATKSKQKTVSHVEAIIVFNVIYWNGECTYAPQNRTLDVQTYVVSLYPQLWRQQQ